MFDISWSEMLLIAAVSVVVIGPKDLPRALHAAGKFIRKIKTFSGDIQKSLDKIMQEGELEEITRNANIAGGGTVEQMVERQLAKERAPLVDVTVDVTGKSVDKNENPLTSPPLGDEDLRYYFDDAEGEESEETPENTAENLVHKKDSKDGTRS